MPNDLRIYVGYYSKTEVRRFASMLSDPSDTSAGWFVHVYNNEGYTDIVKYTRVAGASALEIAQAVDDALAPQGGPNKVHAAVRAVLVDLGRTREQRRNAARERLAAAQAELSALDAEAEGSP